MPTELKKAPTLSDLLKNEPPDYLGREAAKITSSAALAVGTVLQGGPGAALPWDLSDPEDIYGILLSDVPAGSAALGVAVLIAGPAAIDPNRLAWETGATDANKADGLEELKKRHFIFQRDPVTTSLYPGQIDRVPS